MTTIKNGFARYLIKEKPDVSILVCLAPDSL